MVSTLEFMSVKGLTRSETSRPASKSETILRQNRGNITEISLEVVFNFTYSGVPNKRVVLISVMDGKFLEINEVCSAK